MSRVKALLTTVSAVLLAAGTLLVSHRRLEAQRYVRENSFVSIHFIAAGAAMDEMATGNFEDLMKLSPAMDALMRPFPDGLVYRGEGDTFKLEEPRARSVSLLRRDRLVATERKWPRWQHSGEYARKFPGQVVPDSGYE